MHLEPIKAAADIKLANIAVQFTTEGTNLTGITLSDGKQTFLIKRADAFLRGMSAERALGLKVSEKEIRVNTSVIPDTKDFSEVPF